MRASRAFGTSPPPSRAGANTRIASAVEGLSRMETIAGIEEQREVKAHATALYRTDVRARGDLHRELAVRERKLRNEIAAARFKAHQSQLAQELDTFAVERERLTTTREQQALRHKQDELHRTAERLRKRRQFYSVRKIQALTLMDLEKARVVEELQTKALPPPVSIEAQKRSVRMLLAQEAKSHVSPPASPSGSRCVSPNNLNHSNDGQQLPLVERPVTRRVEHATHGLSPATHGLDGRQTRMRTHTTQAVLPQSRDSSMQQQRALTPGANNSRPPTRLSPTRHVALAKKEAERVVARLIAADAAAANKRYRDEHQVVRSLTPAAQLMMPVPKGGGRTSPIFDVVGSQLVHAKRHAKAWQRMFGRFEDALQGSSAERPRFDARSNASRSGHPVENVDWSENDPLVGNESRPGTSAGGGRPHGGGPSGIPRPRPSGPNRNMAEEFFGAESQFEAVEDPHPGQGSRRRPSSTSSCTTTDDPLGDLSSDESEISDERLRLVIDGAPPPPAPLTDPTHAARTTAAQRLQQWYRQVGRYVCWRRRRVREMRKYYQAVKEREAATRIQRSWIRTRKGGSPPTVGQ